MLKKCYITRINNDPNGKVFGFAVTEQGEDVYIPGQIIQDWHLERDEVGTAMDCTLKATPDKRADYLVTSLICDDNALVEANRRMARRIEELEAMVGGAA